MKRLQVEFIGALVRIKGFVGDHPITPGIARAAALMIEVDGLITSYGAAGANQIGGFGGYRGGSTERKILGKQISTVLVDMASIARGLDPIAHPGIADEFRLETSRRNYQGLIDTGAAFLLAVEAPTVKALFTDRGFAADFDTQLEASLAAFAVATNRKFDGQRDRKEGTVSLAVLDKKAVRVLKELRSIMVRHLRQNAPDLLDVWNAAARVYRGSVAEEETVVPGGGGTGEGTGTVPAGSGS